MALGFFFDSTRCTGCRTCAMACADYRDLPLGHRYRRVIDYEGGSCLPNPDGTCLSTSYAYHVSLACNHCEEPECVHVCPTGAMHKDGLGLVCVDEYRCIGCGYCTIACPYHAPSIDPELKRSSKCDGCTDRVARGEAPVCVEACPLRALDFGEVGDLLAAHPGASTDILPLPDSSYTSPNLLVHMCDAALRAQDDPGFVANPLEISNNETENLPEGFASGCAGERG